MAERRGNSSTPKLLQSTRPLARWRSTPRTRTSCISRRCRTSIHSPDITNHRRSTGPWMAPQIGIGSFWICRRRIRPSLRSPSIEDPSTIYAATDGSDILKSNDSGQTWTAAQHLPADVVCCVQLTIDPAATSRIYAATRQGVFLSTDAAASWDAAQHRSAESRSRKS